MKIILALLVSFSAFGQVPLPNPGHGGGGGGGSGTVTSIATSCGVTGGTITTSGTIKQSQAVNAQTGVTYTVLDGDCGKLITATNAASIAVTLPQSNGSTFVAGWTTDIYVGGAGTVTITPTTSTINGAATLVLYTGFSGHIVSDGTNYTAELFAGFDPSKNGCSLQSGFTSGGLAFCVANVAGTATTLIWPLDSGSAANATVLTLGAVATCPTLLPAFAPTTCRFMTWTAVSGGTSVYTFSQGVIAPVSQTGSFVALYTTAGDVPALAAGSCWHIGYAISNTNAATYEVQLFVDGSNVAIVSSNNDWTGFLTQNLFDYCNDAGVQNAQHVINSGGFYCTGGCLNPNSNISQAFTFSGVAPVAATAVDWSTGSHTISIRTRQSASTLTGNHFYVSQ